MLICFTPDFTIYRYGNIEDFLYISFTYPESLHTKRYRVLSVIVRLSQAVLLWVAGCVVQSVVRVTEESEVPGLILSPTTFFRGN